MAENILIIGDSNMLIGSQYLYHAKSHDFPEKSFSEHLDLSLKQRDSSNKYNIYNVATWGETLLDFYNNFIIKGPLATYEADSCIIGYGTNDANYYYSLNSNIVPPSLHGELLKSLISIVQASTTIRDFLLLPVPPIRIMNDPLRQYYANSAVSGFNAVRNNIAIEYGESVKFVDKIRYTQNHLNDDGLHLNSTGLSMAARQVAATIVAN